MLRLLAFFAVRSSGLLWLQFQSVFIYVFDRHWKSTLLFQGNTADYVGKCQEECQFNFICSSSSSFAHKIKHKIKKLLL